MREGNYMAGHTHKLIYDIDVLDYVCVKCSKRLSAILSASHERTADAFVGKRREFVKQKDSD